MSDIKKTDDANKNFSLDGGKGTDFVVGDIHGNFLDTLKNLPEGKTVTSSLALGETIPTLTGKNQGKQTSQILNDILAHEAPHDYYPKDIDSVARAIGKIREEGLSPLGNHESLTIPKKK